MVSVQRQRAKNPEGDINPTPTDATGSSNTRGTEPNENAHNIPPQVLGRRIVLGIEDFARETFLALVVGIQIALAIQTIRDVIVSAIGTLARGVGTFELLR